jgi:transcriptional regulator with XRE-family HTH domain
MSTELQTYIQEQGRAQLASALGCHPSAVGHWLRGIRTPSPRMARRLIAHAGGRLAWSDIYGQPVARDVGMEKSA